MTVSDGQSLGQQRASGPSGRRGPLRGASGRPKKPASPKFWDRIADRYARTPVADEAAYQTKLQVTQGYLRPDMDLLEIGCGTGSTALTHASHVRHIQAIDLSSKMIEIAQSKARAGQIENVRFQQAAIETFEAPDQSYDAVLALSILHLLEDRAEAIRKAHSWLKPGGLFVTSTACLADTMWYLKFVFPIGRALGLIPLVKFFTARELEKSLVDAGFEIDHIWRPGRGKAVFIIAKKRA